MDGLLVLLLQNIFKSLINASKLNMQQNTGQKHTELYKPQLVSHLELLKSFSSFLSYLSCTENNSVPIFETIVLFFVF